MPELKKKDSAPQTKKQFVSSNDSDLSSSFDERESEDESPVRTREPSKTKVKTEQTDAVEPHDVARRPRRPRRGRSTRSRSRRGRSTARRGGRRSSRSRSRRR